jgi:hypothetical protein
LAEKGGDGILRVSWREEEIPMRVLPIRTAAARMAALIVCVCALDIAAVFLTAKPRLWCAIIPALIPLLTPAGIFPLFSKAKH